MCPGYFVSESAWVEEAKYSAKHIAKITRFPLKPNNRRPVVDVVGEYIQHQAPVLIDRFYVVFRGPNRYEIIAHVVCDVI